MIEENRTYTVGTQRRQVVWVGVHTVEYIRCDLYNMPIKRCSIAKFKGWMQS